MLEFSEKPITQKYSSRSVFVYFVETCTHTKESPCLPTHHHPSTPPLPPTAHACAGHERLDWTAVTHELKPISQDGNQCQCRAELSRFSNTFAWQRRRHLRISIAARRHGTASKTPAGRPLSQPCAPLQVRVTAQTMFTRFVCHTQYYKCSPIRHIFYYLSSFQYIYLCINYLYSLSLCLAV